MNGKDQNAKQQSMEELRYMQQVYQNQYSIATNSINVLLQELQELNSAQKTLESVDIVKGKELVTSIGGDFYAFSTLKKLDTFLVAIGANYLVEKDVGSAKEFAAATIQKRNDNLSKMMKSRKEIEGALIEISYKLDSIA
jgi:prefoldin alpha subunit